MQNALAKHWHWLDINYQGKGNNVQTKDAAQNTILHIEALPASEYPFNLAEVAFENAGEGIVVMDANACILSTNKSFSSITGFSQQEVLGLTPKALQESEKDLWQSLQHHGKWSGEILNHRKNGEAYQERLTVNAVKNPQNQITHYAVSYTHLDVYKRQIAYRMMNSLGDFI